MKEASIDGGAFRTAMSRFPAGVTIVTTTDAAGTPWGFTASSFCSLSLEPPLVLVCLAKNARCYAAFHDAESYVIHVAGQQHGELVMHFASKSVEDKFTGMPLAAGPLGHPEMADAVVTLRCRRHDVVDAGDHAILIGRVVDAVTREDAPPLVHGDRRFWRLAAEA